VVGDPLLQRTRANVWNKKKINVLPSPMSCALPSRLLTKLSHSATA
jgi:hypothetical protein